MVDSARPRLGPRQKEIVLRHVLRFQILYNRAIEDLKEEYFDGAEDTALWHVWRAAKRIIQQDFNNKLPSPDLLWTMIPAALEASVRAQEIDLSLEDEEQIIGVGGLLETFFGNDIGLDSKVGSNLYAQLLHEKLVYDQIISVANKCHSLVPTDIHQQIEKIQANDRFVRSIQTNSAKSAAPDILFGQDMGKESTGLSFFDEMMNGGDAPREVYGFMGAFGAGKTTMAVQACCQKAFMYQGIAAEKNVPLKSCHLFFYEASYQEIVRRVWSHAAQISRTTMEKFNGDNWEILSKQGQLADYEYKMFSKEIGLNGTESVLGEYERFLIAKQAVSQNIVLHDFSGMDFDGTNESHGCGYVDEIAAALHRHREETGMEVGAVYVDYVLIACRNHMNFKNYKEERLRHLITGFPSACLRKIAGPFNCCVYLMHQLTAAANSRSFNATFTNADSAESKGFPENLTFNFALGIRHPETGCSKLELPKHRRGPDQKTRLLMLDGITGTFREADGYAIDKSTGTPCAVEDQAQIAATLQLPQQMEIETSTVELQYHESTVE